MKQLKLALVVFLVLITGSIYGQTLDSLIAKFNKGADEINKGEYVTAISDLSDVLAMADNVSGKEASDLAAKAKQQIPLLHYQVGIAYIKRKDYDKAIPALDQAIQLADKYNNNQEYKAKALKFLPQLMVVVGTQKYKEGNLDTALIMFEKAINYQPNLDKAYLGEGLVYFDRKNEAKMVSSLSKAISLGKAQNDTETVDLAQKTLANYYLQLADNELMAVDPEDQDFTYAIQAYEKVLQYDPTNADANYKLAVIYNREVEYEKAAKFAETALKTAEGEDKVAAINYELGNAYMGMAEYDKACASYKKAEVGAFKEKAATKKSKVPGCQ